MEKGFVTIRSAAEILNVSVETLRNWDKSGKLTSKRDASNGYRLYNISQLQELVKREKIKKPKTKRARLTD